MFNAIPWHARVDQITQRRNFTNLVNSTRSYNAIQDNLSNIYDANIEDDLLPDEIKRNIDMILMSELNAGIDREFNRAGEGQYTPVNLDIDDYQQLMHDTQNDRPRTPDDFIHRLKDYISRVFGIHYIQTAFVDTIQNILKHIFEINSRRRQIEMANALIASIDRPRYNINMFPVNLNMSNNKLEWHVLMSIPVFLPRHLFEIKDKVFRSIMEFQRIGLAVNSTFALESIQFYIYQRPYNSTQIFSVRNLLTISASLRSPLFYVFPDRDWKRWLDDLSMWFRLNGDNISEQDFMQQFNLEINVDHTSYVRLRELFEMMESIYRGAGNHHSYIFVVDIGMSANINAPRV